MKKQKKSKSCLLLLALGLTFLSSCESTNTEADRIIPNPQWPDKCVNDFIESLPPSQCFDDWLDRIARQQQILEKKQ